MSAPPATTSQPLLPPADGTTWTAEETGYLTRLVHDLARAPGSPELDAESTVAYLIPRLANERGVERYRSARNYSQRQFQETLSYHDWLARVVNGFRRFHPLITAAIETPEGLAPALQPLIGQFVDRNSLRILHRFPDTERRADLIGNIYLSLCQNFLYDVEIEPWLWEASRHHVLLELRAVQDENNLVSLEAAPFEFELPGSWRFTESADIRQNLLEAIRSIDNRRYRVILLLIFLYDLDNTQLAAFFGVPVHRLTTWLSRARSAARQRYNDLAEPHEHQPTVP